MDCKFHNERPYRYKLGLCLGPMIFLHPCKALGEASEEFKKIKQLASCVKGAARFGQRRLISKLTKKKQQLRRTQAKALKLAAEFRGQASQATLALEDMEAREPDPPDSPLAVCKETKSLALTVAELSDNRQNNVAKLGSSSVSMELQLQKAERQLIEMRRREKDQHEQVESSLRSLNFSPSVLLQKMQLPQPSQQVFQMLTCDADGIFALGVKASPDSFPLVLGPAVPRARFPLSVDLSSACMGSAWARMRKELEVTRLVFV